MKQLFFLLILLYSNSSFAKAFNYNLKAATVIDFSPFVIKGHPTKKGIDVEIYFEVCKRISANCSIEHIAWDQVHKKLKLGTVDLGFAGFKTPERLKYAAYPKYSFHQSTYRIFVPKSSTLLVDSFKDLNGLKIAKGEGQSLGPSFDKGLKEKKYEAKSYSSIKDMFLALDRKEVDLIAGNYEQARFYLKETNQVLNYKMLEVNITDAKPSYLMISKKSKSYSKKLITEINSALKSMKDDGSIKKIYQSYVEPPKKVRPIFE